MTEEEKITIEETESNNQKESYKFKVVVVGDSGVGKTNLIKRFVSNEFKSDSKATVGVEFLSKNFIINGEIFKIEIWDTAGQERYKSITTAYYKGAKGAMIVYDVTNQTSFDNVDKWYNEIKEKASKNINLIVIGNKNDLIDKKIINSESSIEKAKSFGIAIMETSALSASNVKEAFYLILKEMYKSVKSMINDGDKKENVQGNGVQLNTTEKTKKKKKCC
jgi:Ras-related protein Rab-11A